MAELVMDQIQHAGHISYMQNRLREWRIERRLTLEQLATRVGGTSAQQINRLERGERQLTDRWMARLSAALGISKAELLIDEVAAPSFTPGAGDVAKDITERRLLGFWRILSPDAQDFILATLDVWASRSGGGGGS